MLSPFFPYVWIIFLILVFKGYSLSEFVSHPPNTPRLLMSSPEVDNGSCHETYSDMLNGHAKNKPGFVIILVPGIEAHIVRPDGSLTNQNEASRVHIHNSLWC